MTIDHTNVQTLFAKQQEGTHTEFKPRMIHKIHLEKIEQI